MDLTIREVTRDEVKTLHDLEAECYPEDEAASYKMMLYRHSEAPDLMLACYSIDQLVGLICATRYHEKELTHDSMNMHIPNGESVCIHSVAVHKDYRRLGVASRLLETFISKVKKKQVDVARILLICKSNLIPLYTRAGFVLNGKSSVVHGKDPWYELGMPISGKHTYS